MRESGPSGRRRSGRDGTRIDWVSHVKPLLTDSTHLPNAFEAFLSIHSGHGARRRAERVLLPDGRGWPGRLAPAAFVVDSGGAAAMAVDADNRGRGGVCPANLPGWILFEATVIGLAPGTYRVRVGAAGGGKWTEGAATIAAPEDRGKAMAAAFAGDLACSPAASARRHASRQPGSSPARVRICCPPGPVLPAAPTPPVLPRHERSFSSDQRSG